MFDVVKQFDGRSPQASFDRQTERKASRWLDAGVSTTHVNGQTGMSTPASTTSGTYSAHNTRPEQQ